MPSEAELQIRDMVERETRAWNERDADALVDLFHPDMVWPWPPDELSHDPITWIFPQGRFDRQRWRAGWQHLFDTYELVHNRRTIARIAVSEEETVHLQSSMSTRCGAINRAAISIGRGERARVTRGWAGSGS